MPLNPTVVADLANEVERLRPDGGTRALIWQPDDDLHGWVPVIDAQVASG
jgi:hypothetical protein